MKHPILEKYREVQTVNDAATAHSLLQILVDTPRVRLTDYYAVSNLGGGFYLMRSEVFPDRVVEYVPDLDRDTSVSTLYREHPIFESRQTLINAREEIIAAIDCLIMSIPNTAIVFDSGRNKTFYLKELGTAQLLDVLTHFASRS